MIKKEFRRHWELLDSKILPDAEKQYFSSILNEQISETGCQNALGELSYMLSFHYKCKVIVIIDEYDTPIQQGYLNGYYNQITGFMRNLFSAVLKDNENLEFGILTGVLRIAKESLFPICSLKIPNLEIKNVFRKEILGNLRGLFTGTVLRNFEIALHTGNEALFQDTMSEFSGKEI